MEQSSDCSNRSDAVLVPIEDSEVNQVKPIHSHLKGPQDGVNRPNLGTRVVHSGSIYFQCLNDQPVGLDIRYSRSVVSEEQPYGPRRNIKAISEWKSLDLGWYADKPQEIGTIVLINQEGRFSQTIPTEQEKYEASLKVLELGVRISLLAATDLNHIPIARINPSSDGYTLHSWLIDPVDPSQLRIRCSNHKEVLYTLIIYPK